MGIRLPRVKNIPLFLKIVYAMDKIALLNNTWKFKFFLNCEWIFDRLSHEYSFKILNIDTHPVRVYTKKYLLSKIEKKMNVLDLGCHEGKMSNYLADHTKMVVGIDNNKEAIQFAQKQFKKDNLQFVHADALDFLKTTKEKFDVLILSHILEHLDEPMQFLNVFAPFFQYIYIELPDFDKTNLNNYRKLLNMNLIYTDMDHVSEFDRDELDDILKQCGLKIEEASHRYGLLRYWCKIDKQA